MAPYDILLYISGAAICFELLIIRFPSSIFLKQGYASFDMGSSSLITMVIVSNDCVAFTSLYISYTKSTFRD